MVMVTSVRQNVAVQNYGELTQIYNGPIIQDAPSLGSLSTDNVLNKELRFSSSALTRFFENTNISATTGKVTIIADFVKKGLVYQPTYKTEFTADFTLKNSLEEESLISFFFPFPSGTYSSEISDAKLIVDQQVYDLSKSVDANGNPGLKWDGKIPAKGEKVVSVSYDTVGLSRFQYEGFENPKGAQDFRFDLEIKGTRGYNVLDGLSVDNRTFEDNGVILSWNKESLYSAPRISVEVGGKINPADQVSKVYLIMTPIYLFFALVLIFLTTKFAKGLRSLDLLFITVLFVVFFPLFHYLSSFTIDPTSDIFSSMNVANYSMPLYLAFTLAFGVIGGLMMYLLSRTQGIKFTLTLGLPVIAIGLGFFPLIATIPEYFILLSLIGIIAILVISMQVRFSNK
ncbi:MAG: hypothetical protein ABI721_00885 [Candidatus Dojkabacteria bacterium]